MNKKLKVFAIIFIWTITVIVTIVVAENKEQKKSIKELEVTPTTEIQKEYYLATADGTSMIQYGIPDKSVVKVYPKEKCLVGDLCSFACNVEKCVGEKHSVFLKKLIKIKDNCYWFEGNPSPIQHVEENKFDNGGIERTVINSTSFDSRKYGYLCDEELTILGKTEL
jgi:SOS-response transcriptional repressor LexA